MKVLLVKPDVRVDQVVPSLGLGYLASSLCCSHDVAILDCQKEGLSPSGFAEYVARTRPHCVGIQCYSYGLSLVREYVKAVKNVESRILTVIGGPHPTVAPEHALSFFGDDLTCAIRGEAELSFSTLLDKIEKYHWVDEGIKKEVFHGIPGVIWSDRDGMHLSVSAIVEDVDFLDMPHWELLQPASYPPSPSGAFSKRYPVAPVSISRGCPYDCIYCSAGIISGKKIRYRSIDKVIKEIKYLQSNFGIKEIHIVDDNFTMLRKYVLSFCQKIIESNIDVLWTCPNGVRVDALDEELVLAMKRAGCYSLSFGFESGSKRILNFIKKGTTSEMARKAVDLVTRNGMEAHGFFILGFPTETEEEMEETIRFSLELNLTRANYFPFHPLPGTEAYRILKENGELKDVISDAHSYADPVYAPKGTSLQGLKNIQRRAFLRFYLRPFTLWKLLSQIRSFQHLMFIFRRFKRWLLGGPSGSFSHRYFQ